MEQSAQKTTTVVTAGRQMCEGRADRVLAFLAKRHPTKTAEYVHAETGVSASTVRQWIARESAPNFAAFCRLISAYGPELLCAALEHPPKWLDQAARMEERERLLALKAEIDAKLEAM